MDVVEIKRNNYEVFYVIQEVKSNGDCVFVGACTDLAKSFKTVEALKAVDDIIENCRNYKITKCTCHWNKTEYETIYLDK